MGTNPETERTTPIALSSNKGHHEQWRAIICANPENGSRTEQRPTRE